MGRDNLNFHLLVRSKIAVPCALLYPPLCIAIGDRLHSSSFKIIQTYCHATNFLLSARPISRLIDPALLGLQVAQPQPIQIEGTNLQSDLTKEEHNDHAHGQRVSPPWPLAGHEGGEEITGGGSLIPSGIDDLYRNTSSFSSITLLGWVFRP